MQSNASGKFLIDSKKIKLRKTSKMFKIFIPSRSLRTLAPAVLSRSFCIYAAYLNPEKHIYMTHNPSNVYEDILQIGDYPLPNRPMVREVSRVHVPQILSLLFSELKKTYVNIIKNHSLLFSWLRDS